MELLVIACWLAAVAGLFFLLGCLVSVDLRLLVRRWLLWLPTPPEPLMWRVGEEPTTVKVDRKKQDVEPGFTVLRVPDELWKKLEYRAAKSGFTRQQFAQAVLWQAAQWGPGEQMDALIGWWRNYEREEGLTGGPAEPVSGPSRDALDAYFSCREKVRDP